MSLVLLVGRYALMQQCWKEDPTQRPTFSQIRTYLEGHLSVDSSNASPRSKKKASKKAAANRPDGDDRENVQMREIVPAASSLPRR